MRLESARVSLEPGIMEVSSIRVLLYLCGLVYLGLLPRDEFNHRSFIDENALMVGLVRREFRDKQSISNYAQELADFQDDEWV